MKDQINEILMKYAYPDSLTGGIKFIPSDIPHVIAELCHLSYPPHNDKIENMPIAELIAIAGELSSFMPTDKEGEAIALIQHTIDRRITIFVNDLKP